LELPAELDYDAVAQNWQIVSLYYFPSDDFAASNVAFRHEPPRGQYRHRETQGPFAGLEAEFVAPEDGLKIHCPGDFDPFPDNGHFVLTDLHDSLMNID
jgi:hypothetical protein